MTTPSTPTKTDTTPTTELEAAPDGWKRNEDGSLTPTEVPWKGYQ